MLYHAGGDNKPESAMRKFLLRISMLVISRLRPYLLVLTKRGDLMDFYITAEMLLEMQPRSAELFFIGYDESDREEIVSKMIKQYHISCVA